MATAHPFAGFNPKPSPWGYNWSAEETAPKHNVLPTKQAADQCASPEPMYRPMPDQYANMPAALLSTLKREKKPFTYTPGGVNLSEVLNARLQKRMERKKKYSEERAAPKQVIVMPTYNTPLDMYSMQNALEALELQAELVAADKSLSAPSRSATLPRNHTFRFEDEKDLDLGRGVAQSKAFRVLQIITDTEEESAERSRTPHRDEMRFTGIRENKADIPSRFFHTLQKITGTDEPEEEEQTHRVGAARPFEKQPISRPPFLSQHQQVDNVRQVQASPPVQPPQSALRRPAAFLPIKSPGFRPVQPPYISNGPIRRIGNPAAGTDF